MIQPARQGDSAGAAGGVRACNMGTARQVDSAHAMGTAPRVGVAHSMDAAPVPAEGGYLPHFETINPVIKPTRIPGTTMGRKVATGTAAMAPLPASPTVAPGASAMR